MRNPQTSYADLLRFVERIATNEWVDTLVSNDPDAIALDLSHELNCLVEEARRLTGEDYASVRRHLINPKG